MDIATSQSGSFDKATVDWIHLVVTVSRHSVFAFLDGTAVHDEQFGWPSGGSCNDLDVVPSCPELLQSYTCDTDLGTLTGSAAAHAAWARERLSAYCQSSCHRCKTARETLADSMVNNQAYPFPSRLGPVNVRCMTNGALPTLDNPGALVDCETRPDVSQIDQRFFARRRDVAEQGLPDADGNQFAIPIRTVLLQPDPRIVRTTQMQRALGACPLQSEMTSAGIGPQDLSEGGAIAGNLESEVVVAQQADLCAAGKTRLKNN